MFLFKNKFLNFNKRLLTLLFSLLLFAANTNAAEFNSKNIEEAITALEVLGYTQKQIKDVISKLDLSDDSVENIIRKVLKEMQNL